MRALLQSIVVVLFLLIPASCFAQQIDRSQLPLSEPSFKGKIEKTFKGSEQDYPQPVAPPQGAPNVLLILIDDLGFGHPSTFGGPISTPSLDRLAELGVKYNRFHTTAICSPTRAALLTGRNHHQCAFGTITELSTGYPGYHSVWPRSCASIAEVLKDNGYSTAAWGKWHNTPDWETSPIGPFDRWPTGLGFEYFYGFQGGETSQWYPQLFRNTTPIEQPATPEEGYHLTEDITDDAIAWINRQQSINPDKPFFVYFATGATHAPLHAPEEWIEKFKGQFDQGWDKIREETLARQKKIGVVPENTKLTPRPQEIPAWDSLSDDAKRLYARHQEAFAGFLAHTDYHVGRLVDAVRQLPDGDNTLIIYVAGDNGPSAEGSLTGTTNNMMTQNGIPDTVELQLKELQEIGGPKHENHYPVGWAWAGSSPFQWMKRVPSHFGGTRNGLVISWPAKVKDAGTMRSQFHHAIDIAPTIYEAAGIPEPKTVGGVEQTPIAGISMAYTISDPNAEGRRETQYFETGGHRAIYHKGWVAAAFQGVPWELTGSKGFDNAKWELYNIEEDFSEAVDLAEKYPEKLKELQAAFDQEAEKYDVYPLDDRFAERAVNRERPSVTRGRTSFSYASGADRIPEGSAPPLYQRTHTIAASLDLAEESVNGVIVAEGGSSGGYTLYVEDGKLVYEYNFFGKERKKIVADSKLPSGKVEVEMDYQQYPVTKNDPAVGGTVTLSVNGKQVAKGEVPHVVPARFSATETLDVGSDLGSTVSEDYTAPHSFSGEIKEVRIELK
ncbi:sulfatase-like hydrolase/transferase [Blastopirellula sp. JC732]|uniref:Sulfatase-like hydrolase/transferase n=1 Tax=Blastopirellula sediminis TaxID=2894196 RepID=A0A9X1MR52_9BACT|nr:arylsulfatase [Blastopirellula sediminis]MCC9606185.1 sulfatase-like hydrolase/transferase [Blastopirellula sediminis]MCC9630517.1 sulfatase-like hydrolase/transferase [Blastopirellula sediminis]